MLLRSGYSYQFSAPSTSTSTRNSRKRKSADDELDERPVKRQETALDQGEPSSSSHPAPPVVAPPSPAPAPAPAVAVVAAAETAAASPTPFVREGSNASDDTVFLDDSSSEATTVALEEASPAADVSGTRQVRFHGSVVVYLFEADDEPRRAAEIMHFAYLCDPQ
ncbi:hypothetical protein MBANPS3_012675 [Mucor bainieri]